MLPLCAVSPQFPHTTPAPPLRARAPRFLRAARPDWFCLPLHSPSMAVSHMPATVGCMPPSFIVVMALTGAALSHVLHTGFEQARALLCAPSRPLIAPPRRLAPPAMSIPPSAPPAVPAPLSLGPIAPSAAVFNDTLRRPRSPSHPPLLRHRVPVPPSQSRCTTVKPPYAPLCPHIVVTLCPHAHTPIARLLVSEDWGEREEWGFRCVAVAVIVTFITDRASPGSRARVLVALQVPPSLRSLAVAPHHSLSMPHAAIFGSRWAICDPHRHLHAPPRHCEAVLHATPPSTRRAVTSVPHAAIRTPRGALSRLRVALRTPSYALVSLWALAPPPHALTSTSRSPTRSSHAPAASFQGRDPTTPRRPPTILPRAPAPMPRAPATPPGAPASLSCPPARPPRPLWLPQLPSCAAAALAASLPRAAAPRTHIAVMRAPAASSPHAP
ncbi:hypothetical protein DENSPDRAFT_886311 [Dentipellis sp. KUC8613]|nr:hypothetical protein DENSPDRAFT_886311 [Dentipellis sp. KUC8613]